jgi:hypothetical protein
MLFLVIAVTNGEQPQLPKDVRQLKPSLLLDKTMKQGFETERIRRLGTFFRFYETFSLTPPHASKLSLG